MNFDKFFPTKNVGEQNFNLFMRLFLLLIVLVGLSSLPVFVNAVQGYELGDTNEAAADWFSREEIDIAGLRKMPPHEVAKRLTKAVFRFCRHGPQSGDTEDLFESCETACGGYSYVLRGLLEYLGYQTRYANLYNVPQQGNHTGVEVKIGGRWGFLDPTFGAYFNSNKDASGLLSLAELARSSSLDRANVFRVIDREDRDIMRPLDELFTNEASLSQPLMNNQNSIFVSSYIEAEQIGYLDKNVLLPLEIPLTVGSDGRVFLGSIKHGSYEELEGEWLKQTNGTLNDDLRYNDVSFETSFITNTVQPRLTTLKVSNLKAGRRYTIRLVLHGARVASKIQVGTFGKFIKHDFDGSLNVPKGVRTIEGSFVSEYDYAYFYLRALDQNSTIRLFGVEISSHAVVNVN